MLDIFEILFSSIWNINLMIKTLLVAIFQFYVFFSKYYAKSTVSSINTKVNSFFYIQASYI